MLPQTAVLNARGEVIYNQTGSVTYELLEELLAKAAEDTEETADAAENRRLVSCEFSISGGMANERNSWILAADEETGAVTLTVSAYGQQLTLPAPDDAPDTGRHSQATSPDFMPHRESTT